MKIIAHRCGPGAHPEQTIAAAAYSLELGADYVEIDVRFTSDNIPVVCHDKKATRLFGLNKNIYEMTSTEFLSLRHLSDRRYRSHSLDDVLDCRIAPILLHCKVSGRFIYDLLYCLRRHNYENKVVIGVQSADDVSIIKNYNSDIQTLAFMQNHNHYKLFIQKGADVIRLWEPWVTARAVDRIHKAGCKVWVMACNVIRGGIGYTSEKKLHLWADMGVDGMLVNDVCWALEVIRS
ncbi:MAG TPA: glycerophosphodiester phosphodiesterase [Clostridiales bacterium]|nr:glycerophosphodiester phosphodiesterase [Clostridiales bacterium]